MTGSAHASDSYPLCQTATDAGKAASCAACCGMYNWKGFNRDLVREVLLRQTGLFESWDGTERGIMEIRNELEGTRPPPLFRVIINCEYMGFLDTDRSRVGCLLHPSRHGGENLRRFSKHGRETCDQARCTAYHYLDRDLAACISEAVDDWYLYGLCLTDIDLTKGFFAAASGLLGEEVSPARAAAPGRALELLRDYLCLKETWPFARDHGRFGKYFFPDGTYRIAEIDYHALGMKPSIYDKILLSLGSTFDSREDLVEAREIIKRKIEKFAVAYADVA